MTKSGGKSESQVAIVGGGIAGLTCASQLQAVGVSVTVFDKGRKPGGRMSTRSVDDKFSFDYGCQFFSADDPIFDRQVKSWLDSGVVSVWRGSVVEFTDGQVIEKSSTRPRYVGVPEMASVCSHLASGINVRSGVDVNEVRRIDDMWHLLDESGTSLGEFNALIVATPPAQAEKLLNYAPSLRSAARQVRMSLCWSVMLAFPERLDCSFDGAVVQNSPLSWIARNNSKASRIVATECWVGQANAEWSANCLDASGDAIAAELSNEFAK